MVISRIQIVILLLLITQLLIAQDYVDVLKFTYTNTSENNFEKSSISTRVQEIYLETTLPLELNTTTNFVTGFICEKIQTKLFKDGENETFSSISLKIGLNKIHSEKWSGTYVLLPKIASDFRQITRKDFQCGGFALLKYKKNEQMSYKVGLYANSELFGPWFVPLLGLYYISSDKKFEANVTLPIMTDANYVFHKNIAIGASFFGQVRTYHLTKITIDGNNGYVHRSTNELSAYLKFTLTKSLVIQSKVGRSIGRYYRVYNENDRISFGLPLLYVGDNREQLNRDFDDGWVYQMMLLYRIHRNPSKK
ncbi:MAG TPA: DUF6268 family outer membrane beta-barrel protein [Chryseolinea sp.]|nr:DUF6268 family outer membrane beta-barrel protein [Chryseolinea sp.]HPH45359.1 DUF6268 family outer membrane beta-barrel protein [Chryseolinea sp.]HPM28712.1 DUF6268 family outer membrane beta-barrel protein [Chryseolinea sp.]